MPYSEPKTASGMKRHWPSWRGRRSPARLAAVFCALSLCTQPLIAQTNLPQHSDARAPVDPDSTRLAGDRATALLATSPAELTARALEIEARAAALRLLETRIVRQLSELRELEARTRRLLNPESSQGKTQRRKLIQLLQNMKPARAAGLLQRLPAPLASALLASMPARPAAKILDAMGPEPAATLSLELAGATP